jgi:uncharacterized membrane protein
MRAQTPDESMTKNGSKPRMMDAAEGSIEVNAPVAEIYQRWLVFEDYPKFITFNGKRHETLLEMMLRVPERRMAWRTIADQRAPDHFAAGVVSFTALPDKRTCITLKLTSSFGGAVSERIRCYLQNFKQLVETGEIPGERGGLL